MTGAGRRVVSRLALVIAVLAGGYEPADGLTTLKGAGPFTVFALINQAFEALGTDKLEVLLAPENQALLQKILIYHVISGDVRAADLVDGGTATTVEGTEVIFDLSGATPMVNGANIIATDIVAENGVIHLIDGVLTENADIVDVVILDGFETLVAFVAEASGIEPTAQRAEAVHWVRRAGSVLHGLPSQERRRAPWARDAVDCGAMWPPARSRLARAGRSAARPRPAPPGGRDC